LTQLIKQYIYIISSRKNPLSKAKYYKIKFLEIHFIQFYLGGKARSSCIFHVRAENILFYFFVLVGVLFYLNSS
jgi:hypothetical protein